MWGEEIAARPGPGVVNAMMDAFDLEREEALHGRVVEKVSLPTHRGRYVWKSGLDLTSTHNQMPGRHGCIDPLQEVEKLAHPMALVAFADNCPVAMSSAANREVVPWRI